MTRVAIAARDRREITHVSEHPLAVDRGILRFSGKQSPVEKVVFELEDRLWRRAPSAGGRRLRRCGAAARLGSLRMTGISDEERDEGQCGQRGDGLFHLGLLEGRAERYAPPASPSTSNAALDLRFVVGPKDP